MEEVTGGWRKFHSKEIHNLYSSAYLARMVSDQITEDAIKELYTVKKSYISLFINCF
jgi:hypothetical protein